MMDNGLEAAMREALAIRLPDLDADTIDYIIKTDLQNWTYREPFTAGYRAALAARETEVTELRNALQWALDEGGWRLWHYAGSVPSIIDTSGGAGSPGKIRADHT